MSLFLTLFGGMTATALLYAVNRAARLSNFWAATLAAGIPSLAYFVLAILTRPGLDTITLHLVAYPTISVLLFQLYGGKAGQARVHWIPLLLIGFFAALVVIMGSFVYIASDGLPPRVAAWLLPNANKNTVHTGFAGVVHHDEEAAKTIGSHRSQTTRLEKLGWQVDVRGLNQVNAGTPQAVTVILHDLAGAPVSAVALRLSWARPGQPPNQPIPLVGEGSGGFYAQLPALEAGVWLSWLDLIPTGEKPIRLEHSFTVK